MKLPVTVLAVASLGLAACTNPDGSTNQVGTGALIGGGLGAVTGRIIGGDTKGAVVGGIAGAAVGAGVGAILEQQQRELEAALRGSGAVVVNRGDRLVVTLPEGITFAVDSATVKPSIRPDIRKIGQNLAKYPDEEVRVIGHTDSTGSAAYNQDLSLRRARSVRAILVDAGAGGSRISSKGRGERQPIASNATAAGRAQNRRVEIIIIPR